jgi:Tfp pilus assembly PilM family ATPase
VVLTGGTAKLKDINVLLHNELGVDVEIADPSYGLLRDMDAEELFEENLQEYTVAIGLALRGWDEEEQK